MKKFIPGLKLSKLFFEQKVRPLLEQKFPKLKYSAGLIGEGSEVLGYDTELSADHNWGPRVFLFLTEGDYKTNTSKILSYLDKNLPKEFMGYSTDFGSFKHKVEIYTIQSFFKKYLGFDPRKDITVTDWLMLPQQRLLEVTSGEIFHDGLHEMDKLRVKFRQYPRDVWLYLLASQWSKISEEEAFVGRNGDVGSELGSAIVAARLIRELMKLCFLMEQKYFSYSKWFSAGFNELQCAKKLTPLFQKVFLSTHWKEREKYLSQAYSYVAKMHNALELTTPLPVKVTKYNGRPYLVIHSGKFAEAISKLIKDTELKKIRIGVGGFDQIVDNTLITSDPNACKKLKNFYSQ